MVSLNFLTSTNNIEVVRESNIGKNQTFKLSPLDLDETLQSQSSVVLTEKGKHHSNRVPEHYPERADRSYSVDDGDSVRRLARTEDFLSVRHDRKAEEPVIRRHCEKENR